MTPFQSTQVWRSGKNTTVEVVRNERLIHGVFFWVLLVFAGLGLMFFLFQIYNLGYFSGTRASVSPASQAQTVTNLPAPPQKVEIEIKSQPIEVRGGVAVEGTVKTEPQPTPPSEERRLYW